MGKLNDARIRAAKPEGRDRWLNDGNALYLRVRRSGSKVFVLRTKRGGHTEIRKLGAWPQYTLKEARLEAAKASANHRGLVRENVRTVAEEWLERVIKATYKRPHHVEGYLDRAILPELGHYRITDVAPRQIADMVRRYTKRGPVAGKQLLNITRQLFRYGVEAGYLETSPAENLSQKIVGPPRPGRERVLDDAEIRAIWYADTEHAPLLRFLLLTGQRIGEAQRAGWEHVHGDRWTIPAAHSKNGRGHWVHLSPAALALLRALPRDNGRVFRAVSLTATQAWVKRWCARERIEPAFTPHDLRRSTATRMNDMGIAPHVVERCLNHTMQGVMAIYNRAEYESERIEAWNRWGAELRRIVAGGQENVVSIKGAR